MQEIEVNHPVINLIKYSRDIHIEEEELNHSLKLSKIPLISICYELEEEKALNKIEDFFSYLINNNYEVLIINEYKNKKMNIEEYLKFFYKNKEKGIYEEYYLYFPFEGNENLIKEIKEKTCQELNLKEDELSLEIINFEGKLYIKSFSFNSFFITEKNKIINVNTYVDKINEDLKNIKEAEFKDFNVKIRLITFDKNIFSFEFIIKNKKHHSLILNEENKRKIIDFFNKNINNKFNKIRNKVINFEVNNEINKICFKNIKFNIGYTKNEGLFKDKNN